MPGIPFALSINHFVSTVGGDAGIASVIGLAVLVLLYFAHARETANVRAHADELEERVAELEGQLGAVTRSVSALSPVPGPVPARAPAARPVPAARPAAASASRLAASLAVPSAGEVRVADARARTLVPPSAPAGSAAPALAAATRLIPAVAAAAAPAVQAPAAPPAPDPAARPATVAGGANGSVRPVAAAAPAAPPPPARGVPRTQPPPPVSRTLPPSARSAAMRAAGGSPGDSSRAGRVLLGLLAVLVVAGIVVALIVITSSGGTSKVANSSTPTTNAPSAHRPPRSTRFVPANVTVSVLNGTATAGLAHRVAQDLAASGYRPGAVVTAPDQTRTATVVAYLPGHRGDALHVARALKLGSASVQPIDPATRAVACPPPTACTAEVVVTVGADLATAT